MTKESKKNKGQYIQKNHPALFQAVTEIINQDRTKYRSVVRAMNGKIGISFDQIFQLLAEHGYRYKITITKKGEPDQVPEQEIES